MELKKKWVIQNVPNRLTDNQIKNVVAGYGDDAGDKLCNRYCYTYGGQRTMWSYEPSCYEHYHFCTQRFEIANCTCDTGLFQTH